MADVFRSIRVHRPLDEVCAVITDPAIAFSIIGDFGRFEKIADLPDGAQEWDLFLPVGTVHIGGRVLVPPRRPDELTWTSIRGTHNHARVWATEEGEGTRINMSIGVTFVGMVSGWLAGLLAKDILARHVQASLEQLRHHIEYAALLD